VFFKMQQTVKRNDLYFFSKLFPVLSNVIYFILGAYILFKAVYPWACLNTNLNVVNFDLKVFTTILIILSIFIFLSGSFSIYYHMHTPAYQNIPDYEESEEYKQALSLDSSFALISSLMALLILIVYCSYYKTTDLFRNSNFYLLVVFIALSIASYIGAGKFWKISYTECERIENNNNMGTPCFKDYQTLYNMYHTSWHLFIGFAGFVWIWLFLDVMKPRLKNIGK